MGMHSSQFSFSGPLHRNVFDHKGRTSVPGCPCFPCSGFTSSTLMYVDGAAGRSLLLVSIIRVCNRLNAVSLALRSKPVTALVVSFSDGKHCPASLEWVSICSVLHVSTTPSAHMKTAEHKRNLVMTLAGLSFSCMN